MRPIGTTQLAMGDTDATFALRGEPTIYEYSRAAIAEGVIASALVLGIGASTIRPLSQRIIVLVAQGFALLGTLVGAFTIAVGIGPQTMTDHIFHGFLLVVLIAGLAAIVRSRAAADCPGDFSGTHPHATRNAGTTSLASC